MTHRQTMIEKWKTILISTQESNGKNGPMGAISVSKGKMGGDKFERKMAPCAACESFSGRNGNHSTAMFVRP